MAFSPLDSALTGPLFVTEEMRAVFSDRARIAAMLRTEAALARAQAKLGLVPAELAPAIEAISREEFDLAELGRETAQAMVPTIPFVKAVQAKLPRELEAAFHYGSTTQDILDTALVLQLREALTLIEADAAAIISGLAQLADRYRETPCVGRTYGQHAAPITFGYKAAIWCVGVAEASEALPRLRAASLTVSCGGPVGTLAVLGRNGPVLADAIAAELGLAAAPIAWHVRRGRMLEIGAFLATLLGALAKMATDVAFLGSTDVGEVAEPHQPGRGGSSAMPHKRNPVSTTVILAAHGACKGHLVTLVDAMAAAQERPAGAWHAEWHALSQLCGLASGALREARILAEGLEVYPERMMKSLEATKGLLFADAAATRLTSLLGREAAHALVKRAADEVRATGRPLRDILAEHSAVREARAEAELDAAFDLSPSTAAAALWVDRALAEACRVSEALRC